MARIRQWISDHKVSLIFVLVGFILGFIAGGAAWIVKGTPFLPSAIAGIVVGMLAMTGLLKVATSDLVQHPTASQKSKVLVALTSLLVAGIVASIATFGYIKYTPGSTQFQAIIFWMLVAIPTGLLMRGWTRKHFDNRANSRQKRIKVNTENNFMGNRINRLLYMFSDNESRIDFCERPPAIQGFLWVGCPLELMLFSVWGYLGFAGFVPLVHLLAGGSWLIIGTTMLIVACLLLWGVLSYQEIPLVKPLTISKSVKGLLQKKIIRNVIYGLVVLGIAGLLAILHFPFWLWLQHEATATPSHLWGLLTVPLAVWTTLRWVDYLASGTMLSNTTFRIGSTGLVLPSSAVAVMPRSKMTNFALKQGPIRRMMGYYILKDEGQGQNDDEFQNIRVKNGPQLYKLLPNDGDVAPLGTRKSSNHQPKRRNRRYHGAEKR